MRLHLGWMQGLSGSDSVECGLASEDKSIVTPVGRGGSESGSKASAARHAVARICCHSRLERPLKWAGRAISTNRIRLEVQGAGEGGPARQGGAGSARAPVGLVEGPVELAVGPVGLGEGGQRGVQASWQGREVLDGLRELRQVEGASEDGVGFAAVVLVRCGLLVMVDHLWNRRAGGRRAGRRGSEASWPRRNRT